MVSSLCLCNLIIEPVNKRGTLSPESTYMFILLSQNAAVFPEEEIKGRKIKL